MALKEKFSGDTGMKLTSRERVRKALNFEAVDRVPRDLGGTMCSGAHVSVVAKLRKALGLADKRIKVIELYQMLGEVDGELRERLGIDVVNLPGPKNFFGFENADWKSWRTFDGTDVLVPGKFNTEPDASGDVLQYPEGDKTATASGRMPKGGFYFDAIVRQEPIDESKLNPEDNLEEFVAISDEDLAFYERGADELYRNTDLAIAAHFPGTGLGDIALVTGVWMKKPKGIRDITEWYMSVAARKGYIKEVFDGQSAIAVENLKKIYQAVGNRVDAVFMDGTDLATQDSLFCSADTYRELYMPYSKRMNDWIHENTEWKIMKHCCGACEPLIESFIEAGFDILNPVQTSARGMEPAGLVEKYGGRVVFWGGGVDTQKTLPFGSADEVYEQVRERVEVFNRKNGFVFNTIHNIQCNSPIENLLAMFRALGADV